MNKKLILGITILAMVVLAPSIWSCTGRQTSEPPIPPPPITPVTPGYIQGYDHRLGYGFEYPEDWEYQAPKVEFPLEKVEVFTKKGEPTRIVIRVKSTNLKSLAEVKAFGYVSRESILKEGFVEINDRKAYEVVFKQLVAIDPASVYDKAKLVIFLANDKEYEIRCHTIEDLYATSEEIFDHVINSFVIK